MVAGTRRAPEAKALQQLPQRSDRRPAWVAHAGLGITRPGGAPDPATLASAVRLGADRIELDVLATLDGRLVLRHDSRLADGTPVGRLRWPTLREQEPLLLSLDQGVELLGDRRVLLDVKSPATGAVLARWVRARPDFRRFSVCTENRQALLLLRDGAPRVERWRSFPDIGDRRRDHVARVVAALSRHRRPQHAAFLVREVAATARDVVASSDRGLARIAGVPWRRLLPLHLDRLCREVDAAAISVHHWVLTPHLCEAAAELRLPVATWTVNDATALRRVAACGGVDMVTTDALAAMRIAWATLVPPAGARRAQRGYQIGQGGETPTTAPSL